MFPCMQGQARQAVSENVPRGDEAHSAVEGAGKQHVQPAARAVKDNAKPMADDVADNQVRAWGGEWCMCVLELAENVGERAVYEVWFDCVLKACSCCRVQHACRLEPSL